MLWNTNELRFKSFLSTSLKIEVFAVLIFYSWVNAGYYLGYYTIISHYYRFLPDLTLASYSSIRLAIMNHYAYEISHPIVWMVNFTPCAYNWSRRCSTHSCMAWYFFQTNHQQLLNKCLLNPVLLNHSVMVQHTRNYLLQRLLQSVNSFSISSLFLQIAAKVYTLYRCRINSSPGVNWTVSKE